MQLKSSEEFVDSKPHSDQIVTVLHVPFGGHSNRSLYAYLVRMVGMEKPRISSCTVPVCLPHTKEGGWNRVLHLCSMFREHWTRKRKGAFPADLHEIAPFHVSARRMDQWTVSCRKELMHRRKFSCLLWNVSQTESGADCGLRVSKSPKRKSHMEVLRLDTYMACRHPRECDAWFILNDQEDGWKAVEVLEARNDLR